MRKTGQVTLVLVVLLTILSSGISCKSVSTASTTASSTVNTTASSITNNDDSAIRAYADPETETTLQGLSENNIAKYTQYGNPEFKAALTQDIFNKTYTQINSQLGTYVSKEFLSTEQQQGYTIVHYKAKFTKGNTGIRMVFDSNHLVAGQWFE